MKDVETLRAQTQLEKLRATDVVKATIARESTQQAADAKNYQENAQANAALYSEQKSADAKAYKTKIAADAKTVEEQARSNYSEFQPSHLNPLSHSN